jgi:uncharacterized LabA/DUF88 family protein
MIKHKSQRVGVFIDVQNMYYSARKLYGHKVNFGEILVAAEAGRQLIRAIAYVVRATGDEGAFFEALNARGMETKTRDVQIFEDGARKADWDVGMVVDMIRISEVLDTVVIVSGDGDFVELVEYLKHHGKQVEVIAFRETTSKKLLDVVDDFTNLSDDTKRFLIGATAVEPTEPRRPQGTPKNRPAPVIIHDDTDLSAMNHIPAAAVKPAVKPQPAVTQRPTVIPAKVGIQKPQHPVIPAKAGIQKAPEHKQQPKPQQKQPPQVQKPMPKPQQAQKPHVKPAQPPQQRNNGQPQRQNQQRPPQQNRPNNRPNNRDQNRRAFSQGPV